MTPEQMRAAIDARDNMDVLRDDPAPAQGKQEKLKDAADKAAEDGKDAAAAPDAKAEKGAKKKDILSSDPQLSAALLLLRLQLVAGPDILTSSPERSEFRVQSAGGPVATTGPPWRFGAACVRRSARAGLPHFTATRMIRPEMPARTIERVGKATTDAFAAFGNFCNFVARTFTWLFIGGLNWRSWRLLFPQMYEVGVRSVPVVAVTGAFIGMVMAIESLHASSRRSARKTRMGSVINLSVVKQIGPVLAAVMLAGRVGGALTAELGTMNVTEQLDALRVMGADPIRYLVVPRFIACVFLTPDPHHLQRPARRARRVDRLGQFPRRPRRAVLVVLGAGRRHLADHGRRSSRASSSAARSA